MIYHEESTQEAIKKMYQKAVYQEIEPEVLSLLESLFQDALVEFGTTPEKLDAFFGQENTVDKQVAALAIVANAIMNLDEFLTHG